jgi:hypothetical protein
MTSGDSFLSREYPVSIKVQDGRKSAFFDVRLKAHCPSKTQFSAIFLVQSFNLKFV